MSTPWPEVIRRCARCGEAKPIAEFRKRAPGSEVRHSYCRACQAIRRREYKERHRDVVRAANARYREQHPEVFRRSKQRRRERNPNEQREYYEANREAVLAKQKRYYDEHREERAAYSELWQRENLEKVRAYHRRWREANPDKASAHGAVKKALAAGQLSRPEVCQDCNRPARLHAHHEDYARPLDVIWLCPMCHKHRHLPAATRRVAA